MEMLTKYIILVDSAIPLSEKQCFLTFSITGSFGCECRAKWTWTESDRRAQARARAKETEHERTSHQIRCKQNRLLNVGFHFQTKMKNLLS